jgi:hypothetical protein
MLEFIHKVKQLKPKSMHSYRTLFPTSLLLSYHTTGFGTTSRILSLQLHFLLGPTYLFIIMMMMMMHAIGSSLLPNSSTIIASTSFVPITVKLNARVPIHD